MQKAQFSEARIVAEIVQKPWISRPTYYLWQQRYGAAGIPELQRLKSLQKEHKKRERMDAELALKNTAIKDVLSRTL